MTSRAGFKSFFALALAIFACFSSTRAEPEVQDPRVERLLKAQDLAESGEVQKDFQSLVQAACLREEAGDVVTIDPSKSPGRILSNDEDDLSVVHLLSKAMALAPRDQTTALHAAHDRVAAGSRIGSAICGHGQENVRGTGYVVRYVYDVTELQKVQVPPLKPDEPIFITVRADTFGKVSFELLGPLGVACNSAGPPDRTAFCTAPRPGTEALSKGYKINITNHSNLVTHVSVYVS